jgi:hypothetical protein
VVVGRFCDIKVVPSRTPLSLSPVVLGTFHTLPIPERRVSVLAHHNHNRKNELRIMDRGEEAQGPHIPPPSPCVAHI